MTDKKKNIANDVKTKTAGTQVDKNKTLKDSEEAQKQVADLETNPKQIAGEDG